MERVCSRSLAQRLRHALFHGAIIALVLIGESKALPSEHQNGCSDQVRSRERAIALTDGTLAKEIYDGCANYPVQLVMNLETSICDKEATRVLAKIVDVLKRLVALKADGSELWGSIAVFLANTHNYFAFDRAFTTPLDGGQHVVTVQREKRLALCEITIRQRRME